MGQSPSKSIMGQSPSKPRPWSELPDLALHKIATKLGSHRSPTAFAGVCRSWRFIAKSSMIDVIASQPPLLLTLGRHGGFNNFYFYSIADKKFYKAKSPRLAQALSTFRILGQSHGYLIAFNLKTHAGALLHLSSGTTTHLPISPHGIFSANGRALLTSRRLGKKIVVHYETKGFFSSIYYFIVEGSTSESWRKFTLPDIGGSPVRVDTVAVHDDTLYVSIYNSKAKASHVAVIDISRADSFTVVRVIEPPFVWRIIGVMSVEERELVVISYNMARDGEARVKAHRWGLSGGEWAEGLGGGGTVFVDDDWRGGFVWKGGAVGKGVYCAYSRNRLLDGCHCYNTLLFYRGELGGRLKGKAYCRLIPDGYRAWVYPNDCKHWGFKRV